MKTRLAKQDQAGPNIYLGNTFVNKYCIFKEQTQVYLFLPVINNYISFTEIK